MTTFIKRVMDKKASKKAKARGEEHLYEYLGLPEDASQEEIKKAYRKLALRHHPDRGTGDDLVFKQINNANSVLSDEHKRKIYDVYGVKGLEMAEQFGEDAFVKYILGESRYCVLFRILFDVSFHKSFKPPEEEKKKVSFGEKVKSKLNLRRKLTRNNDAKKEKITVPRSRSNDNFIRREQKAIEPRRNSFT